MIVSFSLTRIFNLNTSKQEQSGLILDLVSAYFYIIRNQ